MTRRCSRRPLRAEPENGWVDWELVAAVDAAVEAAPSVGCRLDLVTGRLISAGSRRPPTGLPASSGDAVDGSDDRSEDWIGVGLVRAELAATSSLAAAVEASRSPIGGLRVVWSEQDARSAALESLWDALAERPSWVALRDGTAMVGQWVAGRFADAAPGAPVDEMMIPWLPGLWRARELESLGRWAAAAGYSAVVPVGIDASPRLLREFAESTGLDESRTLRLFLRDSSDTEALIEQRDALAEAGVRWWFERMPGHPLPRVERIRRVSGALGLLGWLARGRRSTGWVEGHRQAARRLEAERIDVRDLLAEGNLRLLEWLDRRVGETLLDWFEEHPDLEGEPPVLRGLRTEIAPAVTRRRPEPVGMADSGP